MDTYSVPPEDLFLSYSGRDAALGSAAVERARADLCALGVPAGLGEAAFSRVVGALLLQQPIVRRIDRLLARPQRFGAVRHAEVVGRAGF